MAPLLLIAYAFAVGLTLSGIAASVLELVKGRRAGLRPPFIERGKFLSSLGSAALAGPYMIGNEALAAWREGVIGGGALAFWAVVAAVWASASGVVIVELALAARTLIS